MLMMMNLKRLMPGTPVSKLEIVGETKKTGSKVTFMPDKNVFTTLEFKSDFIDERLQELAFQNKGITLVFIDKRKEGNPVKEYHSEQRTFRFY